MCRLQRRCEFKALMNRPTHRCKFNTSIRRPGLDAVQTFIGRRPYDMDYEKRLIDIELKLIAQEDLTQQLNDQVYRQQKQLQELQAMYKALVRRVNQGE